MRGQYYIRKFTAPYSIIICILIILISFYQLYGQEYEEPAIFNSKFKYFTKDSLTNSSKPLLWETAYFKGPNDAVSVREDIVDGENCLGLHVYQDGVNDTYDWATLHVKQRIRGNSLKGILDGKLGVWTYPTFNYKYNNISKEPETVFAVEINDGSKIFWFIFSDSEEQIYNLRNHRIIVIKTPLNQWSYREIDIAQYYRDAQWDLPTDISFIFVCGSTKIWPGNYSGYFKEIIIQK